MDRVTTSDVIRKGAARAELYNEGLLVYLYDEQNRQSLVDQDAHTLLDSSLNPNEAKKLEQISKSHAVVAYELYQDDPIAVDVIVGEPLAAKELKVLKGLKWQKPQISVLSLPSGKLRIETPNSCRLDTADEPGEAGASTAVAPGDYLVTLYRAHHQEMEDEIWKKYWEEMHGPLEVIVLTPASAAKLPRKSSALIPFPMAKPKFDWVGDYKIADGGGECKVNFWDYWEFLHLNLNRAAAEKLKIRNGSVIEVEAANRKFTVLYLDTVQIGLQQLPTYKLLLGNEHMTAPLANLPEVAFTNFQKVPGTEVEVLGCVRVKAAANVDKKWHHKWKKVQFRMLPPLELADRATFGKWKLENGALHGQVLFRTDYYISMNFDEAALAALGAKPGDSVTLHAGGKQAQLRIFENAKQFVEASNVRRRGDEAWEKLKKRYYDSSDEEKEQVRVEMHAYLLSDTPLCGYLDKHWYTPEQRIFLAHPNAMDSGAFKFHFKHGLPVDPGTEAKLRLAIGSS